MTLAPLWIVTALYGVQAAISVVGARPAAATILAGYVVANLGLIWQLQGQS